MAKVYMITLATGEYDDRCVQHIGAYLDYDTANKRRIELEDLIKKHHLDREGVRESLRNDDRDTTLDEANFVEESGLEYVYVSYNGVEVYLDSYELLG